MIGDWNLQNTNSSGKEKEILQNILNQLVYANSKLTTQVCPYKSYTWTVIYQINPKSAPSLQVEN